MAETKVAAGPTAKCGRIPARVAHYFRLRPWASADRIGREALPPRRHRLAGRWRWLGVGTGEHAELVVQGRVSLRRSRIDDGYDGEGFRTVIASNAMDARFQTVRVGINFHFN